MSTSVIARMKKRDGSSGSPVPADGHSGDAEQCARPAEQLQDPDVTDSARTIEPKRDADAMVQDTTPDGIPVNNRVDTGSGKDAMVISEDERAVPLTPPRQFVMPQPPANRRAQTIRTRGRKVSPIPISSDSEPDGQF
ncbi:uncharacterized protein B0H18DRAFT_960363 [Fomitopsis serialis]|uniref:uncharacterized protein n=1 Tax=Fomitopsis serialis TaxID=139415 RepID=UPI0020085543|nr:uncharacterized protein B0H18DRAFT_960363 [Neoantrodia serialis]KAH9913451.1 hypothetical protein B0H18DRAFT_960363 [Neoantrodia serialis]